MSHQNTVHACTVNNTSIHVIHWENKMFDQHHPIRKCLKKNLFSLVLFLGVCTEEENFMSMYALSEGCLMCKYIPLSSLYLMYMHYINGQNTFLWNGRRVITESIMKKKTWKFHIILRLITKLAKIFEIYKYQNELICLITYW